MKRRKWWTGLAWVGVIGMVMAGAALAAGGQGSQDDPLVTLSYLTEVAVPQIMEQVEAKVKACTGELAKDLEGSLRFQTVKLKEGDVLRPAAGCQFLPRSDSLSSTDALVDLTTGETWVNDGNLRENHLYIATGDKQTVTVNGDCTLMIQGKYEVK